ncbi:uncharacterized protein LOC8155344 [Sorghum bicolor]|uniref:uncharacterized protein LOC8155344 n=1 Tax=Sorghum bicolor TaxID=4558 RepID=UPI000B426A83|nr:uncharacterized protein LOC8155344 [Sorghum bicolor]|eukprot:XP_021306310.1 uncharacterized protein LOC8155344 [Sorghum bicolor]
MQSPSSASAITTGICRLQGWAELQGWADLPQCLLHSIIPLLGSVLELIAFASTCHSWRAALSSHPSKSTLLTFLPPLLIQPHITVPSSADSRVFRTCKVVDPAEMRRTLCCQIPELTFDVAWLSGELWFTRSSYGKLICGRDEDCRVVDVFTGAQVVPPHPPFEKSVIGLYGMLTAPLSSRDSHLLLCAVSEHHRFLLDWVIGSNDWSRLDLCCIDCNNVEIVQIVEFKGDFIAMGLAPRRIQVQAAWWKGSA